MGFSPIAHIEKKGEPVAYKKDTWVADYKEVFTEHPHDTSQLTLVLPDDCLVVSGPTRLRHATGGKVGDSSEDNVAASKDIDDNFHVIGFANDISYTESRNVQPIKAIGSRRHIFAATNQPIQIQIQRLMILGLNTLRSLYADAVFGPHIYDRHSKYANVSKSDKSSWFNNVEEDIFRVPIGLGIVYNSPATLAGEMKKCAGAVYFEVCTLLNQSIDLRAGEASVMESVTLYADRCIPWTSAVNTSNLTNDVEKLRSQVQQVSRMAGSGTWV